MSLIQALSDKPHDNLYLYAFNILNVKWELPKRSSHFAIIYPMAEAKIKAKDPTTQNIAVCL
jgi:hypothetical protein